MRGERWTSTWIWVVERAGNPGILLVTLLLCTILAVITWDRMMELYRFFSALGNA